MTPAPAVGSSRPIASPGVSGGRRVAYVARKIRPTKWLPRIANPSVDR